MTDKIQQARRELFEAWTKSEHGDLTRRQDGEYFDDLTHGAWLGFNAAPAAPAADAGLVEALELAANRLDRLALEQGEFWRGYATAWADEARATANGVKS